MDRDPETTIDTVVVGGGLAGLVAATTAARHGRRTVLFEPHPLGGRARCDDRNGFTFDRGPRALYLGGAARPILDQLGVDTSAGGTPAVRGSQGRLDGRLHLLPQGPWSLLRTTLLRPMEKARFAQFLATLPRLNPATLIGQSFGAFLADQRLSPTAADVVRMVARVATYAGDPDEVDAGAVMANVQLALGDGVRYLDGGFQALVDGLAAAARAAGVEVRTAGVESVQVSERGRPASVVVTAGGDVVAAGTVVVAAGPPGDAHRRRRGAHRPDHRRLSGVGPAPSALLADAAVASGRAAGLAAASRTATMAVP